MRLGTFDVRGFREMADALRGAAKDWDGFMSGVTTELAKDFDGALKNNTPVVSGELRRAWRVGKITKVGNNYIITMTNSKEYAFYVNNGHRTRAKKKFSKNETLASGKPQKGQRWVKGQFFVESAISEMEPRVEEVLEREFVKFFADRGLK